MADVTDRDAGAAETALDTSWSEVDLIWYFTWSDSAVGFQAQAFEGGGGRVFDEHASARAHMALRREDHRGAVARRTSIEATLRSVDPTTRHILNLGLAPRSHAFASDRAAWRVRRSFLRVAADIAIFEVKTCLLATVLELPGINELFRSQPAARRADWASTSMLKTEIETGESGGQSYRWLRTKVCPSAAADECNAASKLRMLEELTERAGRHDITREERLDAEDIITDLRNRANERIGGALVTYCAALALVTRRAEEQRQRDREMRLARDERIRRGCLNG